MQHTICDQRLVTKAWTLLRHLYSCLSCKTFAPLSKVNFTALPLVLGTFCKTSCNFAGCNSTLWHQNSNPHACWFFAGLCNWFCSNKTSPPPLSLNFAAAKVKLLLQCKLGPFQTNKNANSFSTNSEFTQNRGKALRTRFEVFSEKLYSILFLTPFPLLMHNTRFTKSLPYFHPDILITILVDQEQQQKSSSFQLPFWQHRSLATPALHLSPFAWFDENLGTGLVTCQTNLFVGNWFSYMPDKPFCKKYFLKLSKKIYKKIYL